MQGANADRPADRLHIASYGALRNMAVLLDIDGTLIDSNDAHARAWVETGRRAGVRIAYDHVRWLIGMGGDRVLPALTGVNAESARGKELLELRGEIFRREFLPSLRAFPGARALVEQLRDHGHELVVATSASEQDMNALLAQAELDDLLQCQTSSDDAEESKPAPDIVDAALQRAGAQPLGSVMIGDTPYDLAAARNAGVPIICLLCGGWTAVNLAGAREIYADPAALLENFDRSMLSRRLRTT